jgi:ketosteroid isomerase-like protein
MTHQTACGDTAGGQTPEELETLLEDAVLLRDLDGLARLFEHSGVLIAGLDHQPAHGRAEIARAAARAWERGDGYLPDQRRVVQIGDTALVLGKGAINVARRGRDRSWRFIISIVDHQIAG